MSCSEMLYLISTISPQVLYLHWLLIIILLSQIICLAKGGIQPAFVYVHVYLWFWHFLNYHVIAVQWSSMQCLKGMLKIQQLHTSYCIADHSNLCLFGLLPSSYSMHIMYNCWIHSLRGSGSTWRKAAHAGLFLLSFTSVLQWCNYIDYSCVTPDVKEEKKAREGWCLECVRAILPSIYNLKLSGGLHEFSKVV